MSDEKETPSTDNLSPDKTPKTMNMLKRVRRLNNKPLVIIFAAAVGIILILGGVAVSRGHNARGNISRPNAGGGIKPANAHARALTSMGEGGVIGEKVAPSVPVVPDSPEQSPATQPDQPQEKTPTAPPLEKPDRRTLGMNARPELPRETEEMRKMRERRFKTLEAALDGSIRMNMDDVQKAQRETRQTEIDRIDRQIAALNSTPPSSYEERLASFQVGMEGGSSGSGNVAGASAPAAATAANTANWLNPGVVESPGTPYIVRAGGVIPATLQTAINSDLEGLITGVVAMNVYDSPTGKHLLIPQGSKLIGQYNSQVKYGQSRLLVAWNRIEFPDGKVLDIGSMPGTSGAGQAGFRDRVNHHFMRIFGSAIMMSAIVAGVEMSQDESSSSSDKTRMSDAMSEALGQQLGGVMAEMLQKNMNIAPTIEIREGYQFNVMLAKDLVFPRSYKGFDYVSR